MPNNNLSNLKTYIAGGLLAIAIFLICNCAGYLIFTALGPSLTADSAQTDLSASALPTQAAVVGYVTPLTTSQQALPTPIPLLPTVTPAPVTTAAPEQNSPNPTLLPPPTPAAQPQALELPIPQTTNSAGLQILSHKNYVDSLGWYHIVGEVQNNSEIPMEFVEVIAKLYDDANEVIGTKLTFTAPDVIFPGGKAPFDIIALRRSQWANIKTYDLQVKGDASQALLEQKLVLLNQNSHIQSGYLYVDGEVLNTGDTPTLVKLIITLYDANYNVVNTNWSYADAGILAADATSPFEVKIQHQTDPNNYHYRIQIEEEAIDSD